MRIFGNEIKDVEKYDGRKPSEQSGKKPDARKRISGREVFDIIRLGELEQFALANVVVGMKDVFAQSDKNFPNGGCVSINITPVRYFWAEAM